MKIKMLILSALLLAHGHGAELFVMTTGGPSMVPALPVERVRFVLERVAFADLRKGDPVVYRHAKLGLTTHRLFKQMPDGSWWAKGDANRLPDSDYCTPANYVGRIALVLGENSNEPAALITKK